MKYEQVQEIGNNIKRKIESYRTGIIKYPAFCYSDITHTLDNREVDSFIKKLEVQIKPVSIFYHMHEETSSTQKECEEGIRFLKSNEVSIAVIEWFIKSYGLNVKDYEFIYDRNCMLCGKDTGSDNLKVCDSCANEYKF